MRIMRAGFCLSRSCSSLDGEDTAELDRIFRGGLVTACSSARFSKLLFTIRIFLNKRIRGFTRHGVLPNQSGDTEVLQLHPT